MRIIESNFILNTQCQPILKQGLKQLPTLTFCVPVEEHNCLLRLHPVGYTGLELSSLGKSLHSRFTSYMTISTLLNFSKPTFLISKMGRVPTSNEVRALLCSSRVLEHGFRSSRTATFSAPGTGSLPLLELPSCRVAPF